MSFIQTIRLQNVLSFGPDTAEFPLKPLNVFIGPNAAGKSNLIEALSLLATVPQRDMLRKQIQKGGGIRDWLWKGASPLGTATVDVTVAYPQGRKPLRYRLSFRETGSSDTGSRFELADEAVEYEAPFEGQTDPYFFYHYLNGRPMLNVLTSKEKSYRRRLEPENVDLNESILSQRRDPDTYPELTYLADQFERMGFYREWHFEHGKPPRYPDNADSPFDKLREDASNLAMVLNYLLSRPDVKDRILDSLKTFYPQVVDIRSNVVANTVEIALQEKGLRYAVPATRLSDGTLRYLCLLAVLCHPNPPPAICIEEPETGLHSDIIPEVAELLVEASARSQIFVTTHSDILVDALTETPESVVVVEKSDGATQLRRLEKEELEPWLEEYRLGELWTRGDIGGNRW